MNILKAVLLKLTSALMFSVMSAFVRYVSDVTPLGEVVFCRSFFAILPVMLIYALRGELAAQRIDQHHRQDREERAAEHHLAERRHVADVAHERGHHREHQRRRELEQNGLEDIHRRGAGGWARMLAHPRAPGTLSGASQPGSAISSRASSALRPAAAT